MGSDLRVGVLVAAGLVFAMVGPAMGQSISIDMDRNTAGIQSTVNSSPGGTVEGSVILDGVADYRGFTLRISIDPNDAADPGNITQGSGDIGPPDIPAAIINQTASIDQGLLLMRTLVLQIIPVVDVSTFPSTMTTFDITLNSSAAGTVALTIEEKGDTFDDQVVITSTAPIDITSANFTLNGGSINIIGGPTPTFTPTPEGPPTATPTPTEPPPETGYIVLDGFGAMHSIGIHAATVTGNGLYYPGVDIVVDMDILPDNSGVVVIDKWGANFAFGFNDGLPSIPVNPAFIPEGVLPPMIFDSTPSYVAVEAAADSAGYWVLNDVGQLYGVGSVLAPGATQSLLPGLAVEPPLPAYVPDATNYLNPDGTPIPEGQNRGWFSAVDFIVVEEGPGAIIAGRWGEQHIIGDTSAINMTEDTIHPYFGWDIVRAIEIEPNNYGYMLLDGFGAVHPVPSLPEQGGDDVRDAYNDYVNVPNSRQPYFGWDVAESLAYAVDGDGWVILDAFGGTHYVGRIMDVRVLYFGWDIARDIEIYIPN